MTKHNHEMENAMKRRTILGFTAGRICAATTGILALLCATGVATAQSGIGSNGECIGDGDGSGTVAINELITAVRNSLEGCPMRDVALQFAARVGDTPFACGQTYPGIGSTEVDFRPADMRFYVSRVRLVTADGREVAVELEQDGLWQREGLALLDFENAAPPCSVGTTATNDVVVGKVPAGIYDRIRFDLGVPFAMNHADASTALPPLSFTSMFWNWNGGYKFLRVDSFNGDGLDQFNVHLGSTGCNGATPVNPPSEECLNPNRPEIELAGFDPDSSVIVADLAALLADSDITSNQTDTAPGCQSFLADLDCVPVFAKLGMNFTEPGGAAPRQTFFHVE